MKIRLTLLAYLALAATPAAAQTVAIYMTLGCGCCLGWIKHLEEAGFAVSSESLPTGLLMKKKLDAGLKAGTTSCHTAELGGYVFEGHVPADLVRKFLSEKPDALGLTVPDMPIGAPGMGDAVKEAYNVLLLKRDGSTEVYATIPADV